MGGAILKLGDTPKEFEVITDGHLFDILVTIGDQQFIAEDVLSGHEYSQILSKTMILKRSGVAVILPKDLSENDNFGHTHQFIADDCAQVAIQLIDQIRNEKVLKASDSHSWAISDMKRISDVI